ncbi:hypothetical protein [Pseudanabaena sp. FACHB-2040]|uniref:hypothetical protein n=1 Tax=Pseudanabaena sp. FACHB-2040 TaxID=2692859 RepID=UPI001689852A|nr:hypothetical protein [Pseudanabaena sp. FACHB-2040]MBD0267856.1 hypothetical protein [Cyanobacteria bacterium Co-bin8]MBD0336421.1 hypothetical protein [Cyanobacteria bacterium Co-bin13]MBD2257000.1 hypothetical protein [Pseudanabaena sp. FACHB-2040]
MDTSSLVRVLWHVIEETEPNLLMGGEDTLLVRQVLHALENRLWLNGDEKNFITHYMRSKMPLIRDMASARFQE